MSPFFVTQITPSNAHIVFRGTSFLSKHAASSCEYCRFFSSQELIFLLVVVSPETKKPPMCSENSCEAVSVPKSEDTRVDHKFGQLNVLTIDSVVCWRPPHTRSAL